MCESRLLGLACLTLGMALALGAKAQAKRASVELPQPAAALGKLEGRLLKSGTRKPIIGAVVTLPELDLETMTDGEGHFGFDAVPIGKHKLVLTDSEHATVEDTEQVTAKTVTDVTYYALPSGFGEDDLVAVGHQDKPLVTRRELTIRELSTVPGSNGDALKAVQNLPGVARTTGEQVVLRGESGGQVLVNGYPIATAFHFGGLRSTVGNGLIQSLQVTPGNYDARYGNTNAGIIEIETRRPASDGLHGYAQVDLFDASLFVEGPVSKHATFALGGRRSYIDALLNVALSKKDKQVFITAPRYYDFQGTYDWQSARHRLRFNAFGADDRIVLNLDNPVESDPAVHGRLASSTRWVTGQALWDYHASERTQLSAGLSYLKADYGGSLAESVRGTFKNDQLTARADLKHEVAVWLTARAGLDLAAQYGHIDASAPRATDEGQVPTTLSTLTNITASPKLTTYNPAAYAAADVRLGPVLLVPALRVDHFSRPDQLRGQTLLQPRFNVRWAVTETTTLKAGAGMYSRAPDLYLVTHGFGNTRLEPELSRQYSGGIEQRLAKAVSLDAIGFYNDLYHQISGVADPATKFDNGGKGRVYGAELLLKHQATARFYGWIAYTITHSERRKSGENTFQIFDFDQTHNLNVVGQFRITPTWEIGGRFRYVSGNPTTPVVGATYDSDADIYTPTYGALNSDRVAAFHQLDLRVDKHWIFNMWTLTAYLDVQNVYNRKNPERTTYNFDYSKSEAVAGLPIIPSFGVKGEF